MKLPVEKLSALAKLPTRAHQTDAGLDLYGLEETVIPSRAWRLIRTGLKIALPADTVGLIWDKSGLAKNGLHTLAGVLDQGYRGEILVNILNLNDTEFTINAGQKIAQLLIQPICYPQVTETEVNDLTARGDQGFGSTGC